MSVLDWLLDSDPAVRWQALRDLADTTAESVATQGCGARLLAQQGEDGQWAGGVLFPKPRARSAKGEQPKGQPWTATFQPSFRQPSGLLLTSLNPTLIFGHTHPCNATRRVNRLPQLEADRTRCRRHRKAPSTTASRSNAQTNGTGGSGVWTTRNSWGGAVGPQVSPAGQVMGLLVFGE